MGRGRELPVSSDTETLNCFLVRVCKVCAIWSLVHTLLDISILVASRRGWGGGRGGGGGGVSWDYNILIVTLMKLNHNNRGLIFFFFCHKTSRFVTIEKFCHFHQNSKTDLPYTVQIFLHFSFLLILSMKMC